MLSKDLLDGEMTHAAFQHSILDEKDTRELCQLLTIKYGNQLAGRKFGIRTGLKDKHIYAEVLLESDDGSFYYPVQGRIELDAKKFSKKDAVLFLIDYIEQYFYEFFNDDEVLLPIDWSQFEYMEVPLELKGQIYNLVIERQADEFLRGSINSENLQ